MPWQNSMELPPELFREILSQLRANSTSFRDLRIAFTCKALYREFEPLIKERQTSLLLDAVDKCSLLLWGYSVTEDAGANAFRKSLQQGDGQEAFFGDVPRNLRLTVRSSADADLVWSLHAHLVKYKELGAPIFERLWLELESTKVKSSFDLNSPEPYSEVARRDAEATLVYWGDTKDQEFLARALRAFSLLAVELVERDMEIKAGLQALLEEPPMSLQQLEALDSAVAIPASKLSGLSLVSVPCPRIFPFQSVDAALRGSATSLKELHLSGCPLPSPSATMWDTILRRWTFTQLARFTIKNMAIPIPSLVGFLQRNPTITNATFTLSGAPSMPRAVDPLKCSNLRELTATPEILLPLLRDKSVTFPNLESLRITQDALSIQRLSGDFKYCTLDDVTTIFSCIPSTAPSLHHLSLNLAYPGELNSWLESASPSPTKPSRLVEALRSLHQITSLFFTVSEDPRNGGISFCAWPPYIYIKPAPVMDFVAAFPALKTVCLVGLFYRPGDRNNDYRDYEHFWPEVSKVWEKAGSALEKVEIEGIGHSSPVRTVVWVRGEVEPQGGFARLPFAPQRA